LTATEQPKPVAIKKIFVTLGAAPSLAVGGGVFATWAIAKAKNKNKNVPASSEMNAVV
jgi:hypothetical protein